MHCTIALCLCLTCAVLHVCLQDKILQSMSKGNEVTVTNDGATILKAVYVDNPAAKVLVGEFLQPLCSVFSFPAGQRAHHR